MPVSSICSRTLVCLEAGQSLIEAARLMKEVHIGALVIVQSLKNMNPIGIVTDRDLVLAIAETMSLDTPIQRVMSSDVVTIYETESIASATVKMRSENVRRLVVLDSKDRVVSLLSSDDVLRRVAHEINDLGCLFASQPMKEASRHPKASLNPPSS